MDSKKEIQTFLGIKIFCNEVEYEILESLDFDTYRRELISFLGSEADEVRAYLFVPRKPIVGAILVHHQHNGERHLGKSEIAGIVGDPYQFFGPSLASKGIMVLAPDSICFEDRRKNGQGILPAKNEDEDWLQHYNEMCYRLVQGQSLMKKVIEDSTIALSLLSSLSEGLPIGTLGHSYGGNTVIFHAALDERIQIICASGAVCSYQNKLANGTGIEMAEVIPGFLEKYDIGDLLKHISPRKLLILSATEDLYSKDAEELYHLTIPIYQAMGKEENISHKQYEGGHPLDERRFNFMTSWLESAFLNAS